MTESASLLAQPPCQRHGHWPAVSRTQLGVEGGVGSSRPQYRWVGITLTIHSLPSTGDT